jgi:hypothetical protein
MRGVGAVEAVQCLGPVSWLWLVSMQKASRALMAASHPSSMFHDAPPYRKATASKCACWCTNKTPSGAALWMRKSALMVGSTISCPVRQEWMWPGRYRSTTCGGGRLRSVAGSGGRETKSIFRRTCTYCKLHQSCFRKSMARRVISWMRFFSAFVVAE